MAVVGKQTVAESASLSPLQAMEQARQEHEAQEQARQEAERKAYLNSPAGKLEQELLHKLPRYDARNFREREERGGFLTTEYDVVGLPESVTHKFVPLDMLHEFSDIWKPFDFEKATMYEGEVAQGKVWVKRFFDNMNGMVRTGPSLAPLIMVTASREAVEAKISDKTARWNSRFERTAPSGQYNGRMVSGETGREFEVQSQNFTDVQLSGKLLAPSGDEGEE